MMFLTFNFVGLMEKLYPGQLEYNAQYLQKWKCKVTRERHGEDTSPWSHFKKEEKKKFSLIKYIWTTLSYRPNHVTMLAPYPPPPPSFPYHAHLLHLESPIFPNLFPLSFVTCLYWGRTRTNIVMLSTCWRLRTVRTKKKRCIFYAWKQILHLLWDEELNNILSAIAHKFYRRDPTGNFKVNQSYSMIDRYLHQFMVGVIRRKKFYIWSLFFGKLVKHVYTTTTTTTTNSVVHRIFGLWHEFTNQDNGCIHNAFVII
jgi:hypothetical protein